MRQADYDYEFHVKQTIKTRVQSKAEQYTAIEDSLKDTRYEAWLKSFDGHWKPAKRLPFLSEQRYRIVGNHLVFQQCGYYIGHLISKKMHTYSPSQMDFHCHPAKQVFPTLRTPIQ